MSKRTTINDLSKALELSPTLISMVLNGKGDQNKISKITQKRVLQMAKKMGYTPNQSARALRTGRTNVIGLIVPDISNAFYSGLAKRFEEELQKLNYRIIVGSTDEDEEKEQRLIRLFTDQNVDGIIAASTLQDPTPYAEFTQTGKSVVLFDRTFSNNGLPSVEVENRKGAVIAVEALLAAGKRKIGFITHLPAHISPLSERLEGYKEAVTKYNIPDGQNRVCAIRFEDLVGGGFERAVKTFLEKHADTEAFLVANNNLAFMLMKFLRQTQNEQYKKLAIVAFDDHLAFDLASPAVTTVSQPLDDIAFSVVSSLVSQLNKSQPEKLHVVLPVNLTVRESHLN